MKKIRSYGFLQAGGGVAIGFVVFGLVLIWLTGLPRRPAPSATLKRAVVAAQPAATWPSLTDTTWVVREVFITSYRILGFDRGYERYRVFVLDDKQDEHHRFVYSAKEDDSLVLRESDVVRFVYNPRAKPDFDLAKAPVDQEYRLDKNDQPIWSAPATQVRYQHVGVCYSVSFR